MAVPSTTLATQSPELSSFFEATYDQIAANFIGPQVFPVINVAKQSGTFGKIELEDLLKHTGVIARSPGAGYWRDNFQFTKDTYATEDYGVEEIIDDRESEMYMDYLDAMEIGTARAANKILTASEMRVAAMFDSIVYTNASMVQAKGNGAWSTAGGTPVTDVNGAVQKVYDATGVWPNAIIMNRKAFRATRLNPQVTGAIEAAGAGFARRQSDVTTDQLSAVFDLPYVLVAGGSKNTAGPGSAASISQIWGPHAIVARIAESGDMREPCVGRQFHWGQDGSVFEGRVETYRSEENRSEIIRVRHDVDEKQLYLQMACMILDVIS